MNPAPATFPAISPQRRLLIVLAGPSGAGKSSLINGLLAKRSDVVESVSATTRAPRGQERDGRDYFFISEATFNERVADNAFLEHAVVFGRHRYGTPRAFVEQQVAAGNHVIMDIDVQGAEQIRSRWPSVVQIFVTPPDWATLERRLRERGTDSPEAIQRRLEEAGHEYRRWTEFDYLLINSDLTTAVKQLDAIITAEALRIRAQ